MQTVTSADGTSIAFVREGSGPDLVLVHGTATVRAVWAPIFRSHFSTVAMDRRGRGGSGDSAAYAVEREFEDVAAVVESLGGRPIVFGHSFGGLCALGAAMLTDRMSGLVLYEPSCDEGSAACPPTALARLEGLAAAGDREGALRFFQTEIVGMTAEESDLLESAAWPGRLATAPTIARELRAEAAFRLPAARLAALDLPVLLLTGDDSPAELTAGARRLRDLLPNATSVALAGQQHIAMYTAPEMLAAAVLEFARRHGIMPG